MPNLEFTYGGRPYTAELPDQVPFEATIAMGRHALHVVGYENGQVVATPYRLSSGDSNAFSELQDALRPSNLPLIGRFFS